MLQNLSIQDFILIEKLDLDFEDGFCVITGQTGAGKSILLDAILFALGSKYGPEIVRANQEKAVVTITFSNLNQAPCSTLLTSEKLNSKTSSNQPEAFENTQESTYKAANFTPGIFQLLNIYLSEYDINLAADDDLIIKRIQYANGRKKFFINDHIVTQKILFDLFSYLVETHGQHNHTLLLDSSSHLEILDQSANNIQLKRDVSNLYKIWQEFHRQILAINSEKENITKEIDYLTHICQELTDLDLKEGEEEELIEIKKHLQTRDKEIQLIESILNDIKASNIEQIIARTQRNISKSTNSTIYDKVNIYLDEIYNKTEETKSALTHILYNFDLPKSSLPEIEDRLYAIKSIARKHSCLASDLGLFMQNSQENLKALQKKIKNSSELSNKILKAKQEYLDKAQLLSKTRKIAALKLENKIMNELSMVDMKKAVFSIEIQSDENNAGASGIDEVRFFASINPGMPKAPIDKVASGGELSRFMLGFRSALFEQAIKQTIIFDEVDVGISGSVADSVGQRLKMLSSFAQVIVITHQPQVASKAKQHIVVEKTQTTTNTSVTAYPLDFKQRSHELARMISGKEITPNSLATATELLQNS